MPHLDLRKCADFTPWVAAAIKDEGRYSPEALWKDEPTADFAHDQRIKRIKFLRKHVSTSAKTKSLADRLESCGPKARCLSGACPECGRIFQRWFVRRSKQFIAKQLIKDNCELVVITAVPKLTIQKGKLHALDIVNFTRRVKYALDVAEVDFGLGGIDFSFNEDRAGAWQPFWCPHIYLITSTGNKKALKKKLCRQLCKTDSIPRPVKISSFENIPCRRSYALKMDFRRRIGYVQIKPTKDGNLRQCRNTNDDKLRALERLELFIYLDAIGLKSRTIFRRAKPIVHSPRVNIEPC